MKSLDRPSTPSLSISTPDAVQASDFTPVPLSRQEMVLAFVRATERFTVAKPALISLMWILIGLVFLVVGAYAALSHDPAPAHPFEILPDPDFHPHPPRPPDLPSLLAPPGRHAHPRRVARREGPRRLPPVLAVVDGPDPGVEAGGLIDPARFLRLAPLPCSRRTSWASSTGTVCSEGSFTRAAPESHATFTSRVAGVPQARA